MSGPGDDEQVDIDEKKPDEHAIEKEEEQDILHSRLNALLEALVFHLKLIVITLNERDDAQVIFETLNSAGQPLLAMDLVRNNIFHRAEVQYNNLDEAERYDNKSSRQRAESLYRKVWAPFDDAWWRNVGSLCPAAETSNRSLSFQRADS